MPCSDGGYGEYLREQEAVKKAIEPYKEKVDVLTDLLCKTCAKVGFNSLDKDVADWYKNHLQQDLKRVVNEFNSKMYMLSGEDLRKIEAVLDEVNKTKE